MDSKQNIKQKIRIKDIAEKAHVSIGTVDRVLHNRGEVNTDTRAKVLEIVEELGYTPNLLAKSLASKKIYHIAILMPGSDDSNPYWKKPLIGLQRAEEEIKDFNSVIEIFKFNPTDEKSFLKMSEKVLKQNPDGVVFNPVFQRASYEFIHNLDLRKIPYVYFDIDLDKGNNLAYFGQDAWQSGFVSAKLLNKCIPDQASVLILKLANNKLISHHLTKREQGFLNYFSTKSFKNIELISKEIDLLDPNELEEILLDTWKLKGNLAGVFVPSSRVFKVAELFDKYFLKDLLLIGYDLIEENLKYLNSGDIDFLISQKPEEQGYKGVMALFRFLVSKQAVDKLNHSPIDIIVKENINHYNVNKW